MQPNIPMGGRADSIAVDPAVVTHLLVASDTGGLFNSTDAGVSWQHVDTLSEFAMRGVAFHPRKPAIVFATVSGEYDYRIPGGGGIWRSVDGGSTWAHVLGLEASSKDALSAYEIAYGINGRVYVGTSQGLAFSRDDGATWTMLHPFAPASSDVLAVSVSSKGFVYAAGAPGVRVSKDLGAHWAPAPPGNAGVGDMHALAASPVDPLQAFFVDGSSNLLVTENGGDSWTPIRGVPLRAADSGCGGIAFVKARRLRAPPASVRMMLYYGNRCTTYRASLTKDGSAPYSYSLTWTALTSDHGDTRDIAFNPVSEPILMASDGGVHGTINGGVSWTLSGGGPLGYDALQITEVQSQRIGSDPVRDLYFATQDNSLWSSSDDGMSWGNNQCCEGFFIETQYHVSDPADSFVTYTACSGCSTFKSGRLFSLPAAWNQPPGGTSNDPKLLIFSGRLQGVDTAGTLQKGLAQTFDEGVSWSQFSVFNEARRDLPKASEYVLFPTVYQTIRTGFDATRNINIEQLIRVKNSITPPFNVTSYPAMNGFGGLGILPTQFAWYSVYAVDARDSKHLIAPDVINERMAESRDAGDNWTPMLQLTGLVTGNGAYRFTNSVFPQVTAIAFAPSDPRFVAVGAMQAGIFISDDNGAHWTKVNGSERVTYVSSLEWLSPLDLVVSTYGRGLWRIRRPIVPPLPARPCADCKPLSTTFDLHAAETLSGVTAFYALDGRIVGGSVSQGRLTQLFVTPGTTLAQSGDTRRALPALQTRTVWTGFDSHSSTTSPADPVVGVYVNAAGALIGAATRKASLTVADAHNSPPEQLAAEIEPRVAIDISKERTTSPTQGHPYVMVTNAGSLGQVPMGRAIEVSGRDFQANSAVTVALDGVTMNRAQMDANGRFSIHLSPIDQPGAYSLTVRDSASKVLDGTRFIVVHADQKED